MFRAKYTNVLICLFLIYYPAHSFKLNAPSVLLPYNKGLPSNYTLEITGSEGDCFEWRSRNPRVVSVTPVYNESNPPCSKKAILSSVADLLEREVTVITVVERRSGKKLYCEAYTDSIKSIEFESLKDELFLDGAPVKLSIIAKDNKGHRFSSISGVEIKYEITNNFDESLGPHTADSVVRLKKFDDSEYESPENELEKRGLFSSTVLVKALELGTAVITASLYFHGSPVLKTDDLILKVLPNLKIHPSSSLYLLRHAKVNVTLEKIINEDESLEISADVEDNSIVAFKDAKELHAKEFGSTSIKINHENINLELDVHVVKVARLGFRISKGGYNILEELTVYEFFVDLFDEEDNLIYASENIRLDVKFPPKLFHIIYTTANGTYFIVQTTSPGKSKVKAEFKGVILEDDSIDKENIASSNSVSASLVVSVCQRLSVFPPYTLLPVLKQRPMHKISLKVAGGTGNYVWSLSNYEVAKIVTVSEKNNSVELEIYDEIDDLIVTAIDVANPNFISKAHCSCEVPIDLEVYASVVEAQVSDHIIVPVALLGYEDKKKGIIRKFDDCSMINEIEIVDPYVISYEKEAHIPAFGKGCKSLDFKCRAAGHSRINIKYTLDDSKNITFGTTTVLACFKNLKPVYPVRVSVLLVGTSMEVAFDGGPRKWELFKEGHKTELLASKPEILKIELIKDPVRYNKDLTVFRVLCLKHGETTLTLKIGNVPSATLPHPAKSEASIKLLCSEPHSLHLKLYRAKSNKKLDENVVKVPFYGEKTFDVDVYIKDSLGRRFANISSVRIAWDVDDKNLAYPVKEFDFESYENAVSGYRKLSRNFMTFKMQGGTGNLRIRAKITSYRKEVLEKEGIDNMELKNEISQSIDLKLVSLRDLNSDLYEAAKEEKDAEEYCENDSCS